MVAAGKVESRAAPVIACDFVEYTGLLMPDVELRHICAWARSSWTGVQQLDQRLRIRIGERLEQHGVDDGEDGGVDADAYGDDHDRDSGEAGSLGERAEGEAKIAPQVFEPGDGTVAPDAFAGGARVAELQMGLAASFLRGEAARGVGILLVGEVGVDLFGEVFIFPFAVFEALDIHNSSA